MIEISQEEKPEECEGCHYETAELTFYKAPPAGASAWLCRLCAGTRTGALRQYPPNSRSFDNVLMLETVCYVGNVILAELRRRQ